MSATDNVPLPSGPVKKLGEPPEMCNETPTEITLTHQNGFVTEKRVIPLDGMDAETVVAAFDLEFQDFSLISKSHHFSVWKNNAWKPPLDTKQEYEVKQTQRKKLEKIVWYQENSFQKDVQLASFLSHAVYSGDPIQILNSSIEQHNFEKIVISEDPNNFYVLCFTTEKQLFVCFRGSQSTEDWKTNASIVPVPQIGGLVHSGFLQRSQTVPEKPFIDLLKKGRCDKITFCGHSLGGAIAHITALRVLGHLVVNGLKISQVESIAFGAPFFGNDKVANAVKEQYPKQLVTIVNEDDCVPRVLNLSFAKTGLKYLTAAFNAVADFHTGARLMRDVTSFAEKFLETEVAATTFQKLYAPVGRYLFIEGDENNPSRVLLTHKETDSEIVRTLDAVKFSSGAFENHDSHRGYFNRLSNCYPFTRFPSEIEIPGNYLLPESRVLVQDYIFGPSITKVSCLIEDSTTVKITVRGTNLHFYWQVSTLGIVVKDEWSLVSKRYDELELKGTLKPGSTLGDHPVVTIFTHFGHAQRPAEKPKAAQGLTFADKLYSGLDVALLLKLVQIGFSKSEHIEPNKTFRFSAQPILSDVFALETKVLHSSKIQTQLHKMSKVEDIHDDAIIIKTLADIVMYLSRDIVIAEVKGTGFYFGIGLLGIVAAGAVMGGAALVAYGAIQSALLATSTVQLVAGAAGAAGALTVGVSQRVFVRNQVTSNYREILKLLLNEINAQGETSDQVQSEIYPLEKAISKKWNVQNDLERPFLSQGKFKNATTESVTNAVERIEAIIILQRLREKLKDFPFVGIIGQQNAGKSTFVKNVFGGNVPENELGFDQHTNVAKFYSAGVLDICDFPGSNSLDPKIASVMNNCGYMASIFVVVVPFQGNPNSDIVQLIAHIKTNFQSVLFICLNQTGRYLKEVFSAEIANKFRTKYLEAINEVIPIQAEGNQDLRITLDNVWLTDFSNDPSVPLPDYIMDVEHARIWLKAQLEIFSPEKFKNMTFPQVVQTQ